MEKTMQIYFYSHLWSYLPGGANNGHTCIYHIHSVFNCISTIT